MRRATIALTVAPEDRRISIHALHEESDESKIVGHYRHGSISIHALHEESDQEVAEHLDQLRISIHALHEESDPAQVGTQYASAQFQSTLSMRRATL